MSAVLVIGSGGREHALAWKLAQSSRVSRVIVAPGNDGYPAEWERWDAKLGGGKAEFERLAARARAEKVSLVVVGPDNPLADGIVDVFSDAGVLTFGPTAAAARLEASKAFAKEVMEAAGVPTARFRACKSLEEARAFIRSALWPPRGGKGWVVKADGLALGKGVRVCSAPEEALEAAEALFPVSGSLVIEERLDGEEVSWMAFCDGNRAALLDPARDYKRLKDANQGPNTGGMGAYSPVPGLAADLRERVRREVFEPTLAEMRKRGTPFRGVLYAGLMIDSSINRYSVLEFNARFGDPETQVLLPRMDVDLYDWCEAVARGDLGSLPKDVPYKKDAAVVVVGAARGYPDAPEKGARISGLAPGRRTPAEADFFIAGAARQGDALLANGGRVFGAVGMGSNLSLARAKAYEALKKVNFEGMQYRTDIAEGA